MTENLLQKIEEKVMILVTELEDLRKEMQKVKQENAILKSEKVSYAQKLQGLISLLESIDESSNTVYVNEHSFASNKLEEVVAV